MHCLKRCCLWRREVARLADFEIWVWVNMEKIGWVDEVTNEEILQKSKESRTGTNASKDGLHTS